MNESLFPFSDDQVRVLLFRECDWSGRRLLFDSGAVQKVSIPVNQTNNDKNGKTTNDKSESFIEICNGYGYKYDHTMGESTNIGEMVFGSVAMSFKGTSLKVHWLRDPTRILCSQVFLSPLHSKTSFCRGRSTNDVKPNESTHRDTNANGNSTNSISLSLSLCMTDKSIEKKESNTSIPLNVPSSFDRSSFSGCDSGFSGNDLSSSRSDHGSVVSIFSTDPNMTSRKLSIDSAILVDAAINGRSSDGCLQRRIQRNMSTSFENNFSRNDFIGYIDENRDDRSICSVPGSMVRRHSDQCESKSNPEMIRRRKNSGKESLKPPHIHFSSCSLQARNAQRRSKIGLAVCIRFSESAENEMQLFCSEHIVLLESMLCRLRAAAESAYINQKKFHQLMLHAWLATTTWITDLFTAPRLEPIWFSLNNTHSDRPKYLAKHFMTELCWLLNTADTKDTNFFVSTLLTAILTNHLGWVATIAPIVNASMNNDPVIAINQNQAKMSEISKFHPYNVLWAQLGDLYGSIGNPSRLAKTIVCGAHTVTINKVLSVLTYFMRCGDIQRVESTKMLDKIEIEEIIKGKRKKSSVSNVSLEVKEKPVERGTEKVSGRPEIYTEIKQGHIEVEGSHVELSSARIESMYPETKDSQSKGLSRSKTCLKNIATVGYEHPLTANVIRTQSESNYDDRRLNNLESDIKNGYLNKNGSPNSTIRLMVTSPNNDRFEYETASEAIDFILKKIDITNEEEINSKQIIPNSIDSNGNRSKRMRWSIDTVKEGIVIEKWRPGIDNIDNVVQIKNTDLKRSQSVKSKQNTTNHLRKSKTVFEIKSSDIQNVENNNKLELIASLLQKVKLSQQSSVDNEQTLKPGGSVVFVLGDEVLKTPPPSPALSNDRIESNAVPSPSLASPVRLDIQSELSTQLPIKRPSNEQSGSTATSKVKENSTPKKRCTHKKHSGVKFNFEQYPQIVTNYMKNKNLDITNYDFFEKGLKLEQETGASSTSFLPMLAPQDEHDEQNDEEQCECCANTFRMFQTPSNATELEFSNDDTVYPVPITKPTKLRTVIENESTLNETEVQTNENREIAVKRENVEINDENDNGGERSKKVNNSKRLKLITLPIPKTDILSDSKNCGRIRPGYVPSLFVGITDHFIPDMVLQGITSPQTKWEPILKQNLTLASHCATFEQMRMENVAIIANIDKWDVQLVSSQTCALSSKSPGEPIGMSQLVSNMLETVHAMWLAGTSAYQCMSFLESKLKEIYLQSETLAAFLLATEFCSLNTVTTALNLSANDVPLLLSVASIHSPQVTKKYGISFR
ncbi:folliculin-interacting protein 2 isoform X2 [Contarinia nasturtii]|uniref:folliculin-interacting protein 2 isoform X2 n=1 Tax=Contarinia nasturtii TaxID=265458 RepID=UPI0012D47467|nr:folliculin-interacting protein 2 isoform X2 [Contarinia nasturtii]